MGKVYYLCSMRDINKDTQTIRDRAKSLMDTEDGYDYSMRDVLLDKFVTECVKIRGIEYMGYIDQVFNKQIDLEEVTGVSSKVIEVCGEPYDWEYKKKHYTYELEALVLHRDSDRKWIVFREILLSTIDNTKFILTYHVRKVKSKDDLDHTTEKVTYTDYCKYGDIRDEGYVVSLKKDYYEKELKVKDDRGMLYFYRDWETFSNVFNRIRIEKEELQED